MNNAKNERFTRDWIDVEKWLIMNTQVEPAHWFRAIDIARDLNLDESYVEGFLDAHFETEGLERRWSEDGYSYRNFQYRYKVNCGLRNAQMKITVEASRDELYTAVHQVINTLTTHDWSYVSVDPYNYNDRDQDIRHVELIFEWKAK